MVRFNAQKKAMEMRKQGWSGGAMLPYTELEYGGFKETISNLVNCFCVRDEEDCKEGKQCVWPTKEPAAFE